MAELQRSQASAFARALLERDLDRFATCVDGTFARAKARAAELRRALGQLGGGLALA